VAKGLNVTSVSNQTGKPFQVAKSHLITTCATFAAIVLLVVLAAGVIPSAIGAAKAGPTSRALLVPFLLNIAIILIGWRRAKDLGQTLSALAEAEQEAHANAYTDHTTGLGNRRAMLKELERAVGDQNCQAALILLDLDHFKKVNDLYGHIVGDELLAMVGTVLKRELPDASVIARLGGDEFAALVPDCRTAEEAAQRLVSVLGAPISLNAAKTQISASAGISFVQPGLGSTDVLRQADVAMYSVKRSGRNGAALFDHEMERQLKNRVSFEEEIRQAIEADEFVPFFQPLISLDTGELNGFEVLARWRSPLRGLVEPAEFIEIAEQSGQIGELSMRVMEKALVEAKSWPAHLKLAVNISPIQFRDPQLAERILKILTHTGFPPQRLEVEITESSLMQDREQALTIVQSLRNSGITIALDDFGTGYASLSQLHSLPFDRIKIDKSFINSLAFNEQSAAIVQTITSLGKSLSVPITAEGVESEAVRQQLAALGCSDAQGWYFGRAVAGHVAGMQFVPAPAPSKPVADDLANSLRGKAGGQKW
jgi:diguanylate cyclase (GGDEF)-like protein